MTAGIVAGEVASEDADEVAVAVAAVVSPAELALPPLFSYVSSIIDGINFALHGQEL